MDEKLIEFAVFCIENLAVDLGRDATEVYDLLAKDSDILHGYILPCYEPL
ncbi:MAG: DUF3791 domain-containing protein, partial [Oscillospiraceae bacterium]|nr:DUF3791 domain-containing protein [Oscillospiraceae bacterium]